ncbi:TonB-dependent receptor [Microbulbifer hydrolyticus]|uniref:Outer membrane receptor protein involved in Fe transport n=1 Tax=Microbulbifer hydrolyticus TaxID=48074 RepID=A0A6P1TDJ8_9GAMM|nr:TonB-dependent receptor [Microbulbifer hydrolyticus]MBB5210777.1 outer membrane receptor protein involved in Fe transport [Microbulbifer hydrolyticus]QHQ38782.1 TonB-dependent receptor [Microbulbifer hydrolyticus]
MLPFNKKPLACLVSTFALSGAPGVFAQEATEELNEKAKYESQLVENVVVTATRREASVEDIPINISVIDEKTLRRKNITDAKKFIEQSVAISAPQNSARFNDSVTVRGLNVSRVDANNLDQFIRSTLSYYLDETPLPHLRYRIKDIARVETLLGPQGTLYGAGSLGGTVRYITNQPNLDEFEFAANTSVSQTAESSGLSSDTDFVVNLPLSETVALRASMAHLDEKGYIDRAVNPIWRTGEAAWEGDPNPEQLLYKDDDSHEATSAKVAMLWKPNEDLALTLTHIQQSELAHGINGASRMPVSRFCDGDNACLDTTFREDTPYQYDAFTVVSRYEEFSDRDFVLDSLNFELALDVFDIASSTSVYKDQAKGQGDYADYGNIYYGWISPEISLEGSNNSAYITFDNLYKGLVHETRLVSNGDGSLSWIVGLYYGEQEKRLRFSEWMPELDGNVSWLNREEAGGRVNEGYAEDLGSVYSEVAAFGEVTYALSDRWDVTLGARVFNYEDDVDGEVTDYLGFTSGERLSNIKGTGESIYKVNTSYDINENVMAYATLSQGFRRGGANAFKEEGGNIPTDQIQYYKPDTVDNYEVGVKGNLFDGRLFVHADIYQMDWKNAQTYWDQTVGGYLPINGTTNGPDSRTQGVEIMTKLRLTDSVSLTYETMTTDAEWAETKEVCTYSGAEDNDCYTYEKGGELGGSADWRHNFGATYDTVLGNGVGIYASLNGRYFGATPSDRVDKDGQGVYVRDSYSVFDAYVGLDYQNYAAALWVNNLANNDAEVSGQRGGSMGYRAINLRPRTIGLNLSYDF